MKPRSLQCQSSRSPQSNLHFSDIQLGICCNEAVGEIHRLCKHKISHVSPSKCNEKENTFRRFFFVNGSFSSTSALMYGPMAAAGSAESIACRICAKNASSDSTVCTQRNVSVGVRGATREAHCAASGICALQAAPQRAAEAHLCFVDLC